MKRTLIAVAVLGVASGSAFAHDSMKDPYLYNYTAVGEQVGLEGWVRLFGCVQVDSSAGAVVNNNQTVWVNVSLDPMPSTYTSGSVTKTINSNNLSVSGGGYAFQTGWQTSAYAAGGAQGFEESSGYNYHNQSSQVQGGGYEYSAQQAGIQGGFSHYSQDSGGHISAGGKIGGSVSYGGYNTRYGGSDSFHAQGGFSAGYNESSYSNSSGVRGEFSAVEGSGQGARWGFSADQGSGGQSFHEQSSGYQEYASASSESSGVIWGIKSNLDVSDTSVYGKITTHIDTQAPTTVTATTGTGAGSSTSGNIGINITEGVDNAQSNDSSLASVDAGDVFGNAQIFNTQSSGGTANVKNYAFNASVGDNSLQNVSGNVGINVASGVGNAQNNSLAASTSQLNPGSASAVAMVATDNNDQSAGMHFTGSMSGTAMLGSNALQNSQGNIGVNIAGGAGNLQHNGLAIAATTLGK